MVKKVNSIITTDTSNLVKKFDYDKFGENEKKINYHDHSNKYFTTQEFNKLTKENFTARLKQENLATKADIANFVRETDFVN